MASQRNYTTIEEVEKFADIASIDDTEFEERMSQCEELIDAYLGTRDQFLPIELTGVVTSHSSNKIVDMSSSTILGATDGYYAYCYVEIIGGLGLGERRFITDSDESEYSITYSGDTLNVDSTSVFRIFQLGAFPRQKDALLKNNRWYKVIPEPVRRAVAAQMQFMVQQGDEFFSSGVTDLQSESIGNYSYSRGGSDMAQTPNTKMLAPKTRALLRGYKSSIGTLASENPTWL